MQQEAGEEAQSEASDEEADEQSEASDEEEIMSMEEALLLDENPFSLGGLGGNNGERSDRFKRLHSLRQKWFRAKAGKTLRGEHEGIKA